MFWFSFPFFFPRFGLSVCIYSPAEKKTFVWLSSYTIERKLMSYIFLFLWLCVRVVVSLRTGTRREGGGSRILVWLQTVRYRIPFPITVFFVIARKTEAAVNVLHEQLLRSNLLIPHAGLPSFCVVFLWDFPSCRNVDEWHLEKKGSYVIYQYHPLFCFVFFFHFLMSQ